MFFREAPSAVVAEISKSIDSVRLICFMFLTGFMFEALPASPLL